HHLVVRADHAKRGRDRADPLLRAGGRVVEEDPDRYEHERRDPREREPGTQSSHAKSPRDEGKAGRVIARTRNGTQRAGARGGSPADFENNSGFNETFPIYG